jgi:hypothetical protein
MATRFYFPLTQSAPATPLAAGSEWEHNNNLARRLVTAADVSTLTDVAYTPDASDHLVDNDALHRRYVSSALAAQTISGNINGQFQCLEAHANNNLFLTLKVSVISSNGATERAVLLAITRASTELATTLTNRSFPATALTSYACAAGDRLLVEVGVGGNSANTSGTQGHNATIRWGGTATSGDLPVDETTTTTTYRPWVEFTANLTFVAATITKTVKSSGGDYTSLSAWEAGEQGDLVSQNEIAQAECYAMQDTTAVTVDGWTTDATRYIEITVPTAERHSGVWDATKYRLVVNVDGSVLYCAEDFYRVKGVQVHNTRTTGNPEGFNSYTATAGAVHYYSYCISRGAGSNATSRGFNLRVNTGYVWNNLAYDWTGGSNSAGIRQNGNSGFTIYCYNFTSHSNDYGFQHHDNGASMIVKNCLADGNTVSFQADWNWPSGCNYNACDTALTTTGNGGYNDPPGANSRYSQTFTFVNEAGDDFHLASSDAGAKDYGTDLSADANLAFSDDVDLQTRSGSWDIGFDEYVAAGGRYIQRLLISGVS